MLVVRAVAARWTRADPRLAKVSRFCSNAVEASEARNTEGEVQHTACRAATTGGFSCTCNESHCNRFTPWWLRQGTVGARVYCWIWRLRYRQWHVVVVVVVVRAHACLFRLMSCLTDAVAALARRRKAGRVSDGGTEGRGSDGLLAMYLMCGVNKKERFDPQVLESAKLMMKLCVAPFFITTCVASCLHSCRPSFCFDIAIAAMC